MKRKKKSINLTSYIKRHLPKLLLMVATGVGVFPIFFAARRGVQVVRERFFDVGNVTVDFKNIHAASLKNNLAKYIQEHLETVDLSVFSFNTFYDELKTKFPIIKHVTWQQGQPDTASLCVEGYSPFCRVNDGTMLLKHGALVSYDLFKEYISPEKLIHVVVHKKVCRDMHKRKKLVSFIEKLDTDVSTKFTIVYNSADHIVLIPKKKNKVMCEIVTNHELSFCLGDTKKLDYVIENMLAKKTLPQKKDSKVVFDLRLKKQVLVKVFDRTRKRRRGQ